MKPVRNQDGKARGQVKDRELIAFLDRRIAALISSDAEPRPPCIRCAGTSIVIDGYRPRLGGYRLPVYRCSACGKQYTRLQGTPLDGRLLGKVETFVPLLPQPLNCTEAGRLLGKLPAQVSELVKAFRVWLLELDPSGKWEARVRLGGRRAEVRPTSLHVAETGTAEDVKLTRRLTSEYDDIYAKAGPAPRCAHCGSRNTYEMAPHPSRRLPAFECRTCHRVFNRRTGTPFSSTYMVSAGRFRPLIRYLSLPLSYAQVADIFQADETQIQTWRDKFARWADQLEPDGNLSARFRLGATPTRDTPCLFCGRTGTARRDGRRVWHCIGCGRLFSMRRTLVERNGRFEIVGAEVEDQDDATVPGMDFAVSAKSRRGVPRTARRVTLDTHEKDREDREGA
ncbi:hypothetical protein LMG22037_04979 [Paraburkholderia phenoliruptrix]|jgi:transposase-like protein|uniref:DUF746 domain-containing protein n=1 Tax=Paraburkholderia phenoliruptrix TaxID=252970 RepID=A0A6J5C184_9BURK|nr:DUF746 domain-containing protein [Paraburkholderia phenoliruptrix]CAB3723603.1 hypothetical protein LMG22037_04979 [Paraburkholderia phenoliruptrix]